MGRVLTAVLPVGLALAVYLGRLDGPFVFDDLQAIVDNASIHGLSLGALHPPRDSPVAGRPLLNLSLALTWALAGPEPRAFHLHNLILHCLVVALGAGVARRALQSPKLPGAIRERASVLSMWAATLWAVHPLASELVLYATQRSELLLSLWFLIAFACFQQSLGGARGFRTLAALSAVIGAFAKAVIVVLPPLALLYDRAFVAPDWASVWRERRFTHAALLGCWPVVLWVQLGAPRAASVDFFDLDYLSAQAGIVTDYLGTFLWPSTLVFDYGVLVPGHGGATPLDLAVVAVLVVGVALAWTRWPAAAYPGACLLLLLAPTSTLAAIHLEIGAERRMYLPMLPLLTGIVAGAWLLASRVRAGAALGTGVVLAACLALAGRSVVRAEDYASVERIWRSAVAARPENPRAHHNLGETLRRQGRLDEALASFRAAIEADPSYVDAYVNVSGLLAARGEIEPALRHLERAAALRPDDAVVRHNLELLRRALRTEPGASP